MNKSVLITGAASGLGEAFARVYAKKGYSVCLADIQDEMGKALASELDGQYPGDIFYQHLNVTNEQDWSDTVTVIRRRWEKLDCLINNAGVAASGPIDEQTMQDFQWVIDINVMGVVRGCYHFVPMLKQTQGQLINVASMAGHLYMPELSAYNASKAAVVALSETLYSELKPYGVTVSALCPAFFKTNLTETMRVATASDKKIRAVNKLMDQSSLNADDIALLTYDDSSRGKFLIMPHFKERMYWRIKRFSPSLYQFIFRLLTKKPQARMEEKRA